MSSFCASSSIDNIIVMSLEKVSLCISPSFIHTYIILAFLRCCQELFLVNGINFVLTFGYKVAIILSMNENDISYLIFLFFAVTGATTLENK